jgi:hypothetical protein
MIKIRASLVATIFAAWATNAVAAGSLYVLQMGDGTSSLTSAAAPVIIKKFDASTYTLQTSIPMPITDSGSQHILTTAGSSSSEGHLALSGDGNYLTLGGYDAAPGTLAVGQTTAAAVNRVLGRVTLSSGAVDTSTALNDAYIGDAPNGNTAAIRSVVSNDGQEFWTAGTAFVGTSTSGDSSSAGVRYATLGSTTSTAIAPFPGGPSNTRVVNITGGQLYLGSGSASNLGVNTVGAGLPTTTGQTVTLKVATAVSGTGTASPYDFWFKDANDVYVADDRSVTNGGGIQKWTFDGSNWNIAYTLAVGSSSGARGLTGEFDGTNTVLWATNTGGQIVTVTDTGASSLFSVKAVSPTNTTYRGIVFVPGAATLAGDYNGNGVVDAADYVAWRNSPASFGGDPAGYNTWRSNFGNHSGSGSSLGSSVAVPEPTVGALLLFACGLFGVRRRAS